MTLELARSRLAEAERKVEEAEKARLDRRDWLAFRRLLTAVGVWRAKVDTLRRERVQAELFAEHR